MWLAVLRHIRCRNGVRSRRSRTPCPGAPERLPIPSFFSLRVRTVTSTRHNRDGESSRTVQTEGDTHLDHILHRVDHQLQIRGHWSAELGVRCVADSVSRHRRCMFPVRHRRVSTEGTQVRIGIHRIGVGCHVHSELRAYSPPSSSHCVSDECVLLAGPRGRLVDLPG